MSSLVRKATTRRSTVRRSLYRSPLLRKTGLVFEAPGTIIVKPPTWTDRIIRAARTYREELTK